jgi:tetratricopeptide repeat protein 21B
MLLKQQPKARNNLKRIAKMNATAEHADEFERAFLLLSDVYIEVGKYDLAAELCKKCIASNKSCGKAWEFLGVIMEKENSFKDAADHYEKAWTLQNETSASVGFKLAFNCAWWAGAAGVGLGSRGLGFGFFC